LDIPKVARQSLGDGRGRPQRGGQFFQPLLQGADPFFQCCWHGPTVAAPFGAATVKVGWEPGRRLCAAQVGQGDWKNRVGLISEQLLPDRFRILPEIHNCAEDDSLEIPRND